MSLLVVVVALARGPARLPSTKNLPAIFYRLGGTNANGDFSGALLRRASGRVPAAIHRTQARPRCSMHHWSWSVQPSDDRALELLAHKITWGGARRGGAKREVAEAAGNRRSRKCGNGRDREEVGVHPQNRTARTTPVYTLTPDGAPQNPEWS